LISIDLSSYFFTNFFTFIPIHFANIKRAGRIHRHRRGIAQPIHPVHNLAVFNTRDQQAVFAVPSTT